MRTRIPMAAMRSCTIVIDTVIPFFLRVTARPRSRGRKGADRDSHAMYRDDLDLAAARDAGLGRRGKDLDGAVVRESDHATSARANAHRDCCVPPDELSE